MQSGGSFKPFKLPSSALFFKPPRTKTENMQKKDFLGHAKVVASVQDNDDFTGFIGAQGQVRRRALLWHRGWLLCMHDLVQGVVCTHTHTYVRSCNEVSMPQAAKQFCSFSH